MFELKHIALSAALVVVAGCGTVTVTNTTDKEARVIVHLPDRDYPQSRMIAAGGAESFVLSTGGAFSVSAMLNGPTIEELNRRRDSLMGAMTLNLENAQRFDEIQKELKDIETLFERLEQGAAKCGANIPEFGQGFAVISGGPGGFSVGCSVKADAEIELF